MATTSTTDVKSLLNQYASDESLGDTAKAVTNSALAQYDEAQKANLTAKNEAYKASEQAKLYSNNLLKAYGADNQLGNALTNANATYNTYQNALSQADSDLASTSANILSQYASDLASAKSTDANTAYMNAQTDALTQDATNETDAQNYELAVAEMANAYTTADKQAILEKYKDTLSDYSYKLLELELAKAQNEENMSGYGITDTSSAISSKTANVGSFGQFKGYGNGQDQDNWVQSIIDAANNGQLSNGDVIDVNYGDGKNLYVYYDGNFYPTSSKVKNYYSADDNSWGWIDSKGNVS